MTGARLLAPLLVTVVAASTWAQAQTITGSLVLGKKEPRPILFDYSALDEGLVTVSRGGERATRMIGVYKYDATLGREWSQPLFEDSDNREVTQLKVLGDHVLVFSEEYVPRQRRTRLSLREFSLDGKPNGEARELYLARRERKDKPLMRYETSLDNRKLLVYGRISDESEASGEMVIQDELDSLGAPGTLSYAYTVFDAKSDSLYQGVVKLGAPDVSSELVQTRLGVGGVMFFLIRNEREMGGRGASRMERYLLYRYDYKREDLQSLPIDFGGRHITDLTFKPDREDAVLLAGIFSLTESDRAAGILYGRIPADNSTPVFKSDRFSDDLLARFSSRGRVERGKAELSNFFLDDIVLRVDGGILLIAEQYYVTTTTFRDAYGFWDTRRVFHYDDILVVSISPTGAIEWNTVIAKQQAAERADQLSYALFVGPEELLFFFKAHSRGLSDSVLFSSINYEGGIKSPRAFFPNFRTEDVFYRKAAKQISNTDGIMVHFQSGAKNFTITRFAF